MNMKSLFALTAMAAVGAASAAVTTGNTLCRIEVNSGTTNTIVAVPVVKIAEGTAIPVDKLVLTNNLAHGDTLLHWSSTKEKWEAWVIANSGWSPMSVSEGMQTTMTQGAENATLTRGDAIWVNRNNSDVSKPFYIYGQVATAPATSTAVIGTSAEPIYTMMGNPTLAAVALNKSGLWPTEGANKVAEGDTIAISAVNNFGRKEYTYKSDKGGWCTYGRVNGVKQWILTADTIDAGCGFWYISRGGNPTVNW